MSVIASFDTIAAALLFLSDFFECATNSIQTSSLGAVFDIDDTMLSSYDSTTIQPVKLLWDLCGRLGLKRYIVTARPEMALSDGETNESFTITELQAHGIDGWDQLYMMPYREYKRCRGNAAPYKERVRRRIKEQENDGQPLLVNIGDQWGDMTIDPERLYKRHGNDQVCVGYFDDTAVVGVKLPCS
jgi:hypothetical protein